MHTPPGVTGSTERPVVNTGGVVDLGDPDGLLVLRIVGVGISGELAVGHCRGAEEVPVGTLRGGEGVAVAVNGLVLTVTEAGSHDVIITVLSVNDTAGGILSLFELTKREVDLGEVVGGGGLGDGTHQTGFGGEVLLGILEILGDELPALLAGDHLVVVAGLSCHVL